MSFIFALSQLTTSADHALDLGVALAPNVIKSDKGSTPQRRKKASSPDALTNLSPAERTALLLDFKRNFSHNFTQDPVPSKVIPRAGLGFATV